MTVEDQNEIADLRARLAGLRMLLHARILRAKAGEMASGSRAQDLVGPVMDEIAEVEARLEKRTIFLLPRRRPCGFGSA